MEVTTTGTLDSSSFSVAASYQFNTFTSIAAPLLDCDNEQTNRKVTTLQTKRQGNVTNKLVSLVQNASKIERTDFG